MAESGQSDRIPRTEAGRALAKTAGVEWVTMMHPQVVAAILAIEDEASAAPPEPPGQHVYGNGARVTETGWEAAPPEPPLDVDEEAIIDNAVPSIAKFGQVSRSEVIRSIVTAIHEQGARIAGRAAPPEPPLCPKCGVMMSDTGYYEDGQRCHDPEPKR